MCFFIEFKTCILSAIQRPTGHLSGTERLTTYMAIEKVKAKSSEFIIGWLIDRHGANAGAGGGAQAPPTAPGHMKPP